MQNNKIAVFSTWDIQTIHADGTLKSTGALERAVMLGFDIYVVSTRAKFSDSDAWWREIVSEENIFAPEKEDSDSYYANSPALIEPWIRLYEKLGVPVPNRKVQADADGIPVGKESDMYADSFEPVMVQGFDSWMAARENLREKHGVLMGSEFFPSRLFWVRPGIPHTYGMRIFLRDDVAPEIRKGLNDLSAWGGHDKSEFLQNGNGTMQGWEFPTFDENIRFDAAVKFLESKGYRKATDSMYPKTTMNAPEGMFVVHNLKVDADASVTSPEWDD